MSVTANAKPLLFSHVLPALADEQQRGLPWWAWLLILIPVILILLVLWWWLGRPRKKEELPAKPTPLLAESQPEATPTRATAAAVIAQPSAPAKPDDLAIVEGIGPKIAGLLQAAGITTFAQLAEADLDHLRKILKDAGLYMTDPATWAEQAKLAAEGRWDELGALQDILKGGRRV